MRIALIDDDLTTNFINENKIKKHLGNCEVESFLNGKDILKRLEKGDKYDVGILDMNMPIMDGLEFLKAHKKLPLEFQICRILFFNELKVDDEFKQMYNLHMCLKKPLTKEVIESLEI